MRLIDADALAERLGITDMDCYKCAWGDHGFCGSDRDLADACEAIEDAPTIDAIPVVHGYWIKGTKCNPELVYCSDYNWTCSVCEYMDTHNEKVEVPYCWHCGARMDGDGNE